MYARSIVPLTLILTLSLTASFVAAAEEEVEYLNAATAGKDWVPLEIQLPVAMFSGTPKDVWTPNLEEDKGKLRPPCLAPKGTMNLAEGKKVTSSHPHPLVGELAQLTDGEKKGNDGTFVELKAGVQYVQVDLGKPCDIFAVLLWHYHMEGRVYFDVVVQVADDPDFIMNVRTLYNNDVDNSAGLGVGKHKEYVDSHEGRLVNAENEKARYVRCYSNGNTTNDLNHYVEIEVFGTPSE